jgi:hypothetical protein
MSIKDYYNIIRKELSNKSKLKTIIALLRMFKDNKFIYHTRVNIKKNKTNKPFSRKLIQLF